MKEVDINGRKIKVALTVDAVGLFCPMPIVKLTVALGRVNPTQVVEVLADDPGFEEDVTSWCQETHNELLWLTKEKEDTSIAYVKKNRLRDCNESER